MRITCLLCMQMVMGSKKIVSHLLLQTYRCKPTVLSRVPTTSIPFLMTWFLFVTRWHFSLNQLLRWRHHAVVLITSCVITATSATAVHCFTDELPINYRHHQIGGSRLSSRLVVQQPIRLTSVGQMHDSVEIRISVRPHIYDVRKKKSALIPVLQQNANKFLFLL